VEGGREGRREGEKVSKRELARHTREGGREGGRTYREQGLDVTGAGDHPLYFHQLPYVQGTHFPQGAGFEGRGREEADVEAAGEGGREGGRLYFFPVGVAGEIAHLDTVLWEEGGREGGREGGSG
jgi:hypothetical protein